MGWSTGPAIPSSTARWRLKVVAARGGRTRERLLAEARVLARGAPGDHPVYDVGPAADGVYIAMPLVEGGTLADCLAAGRRP